MGRSKSRKLLLDVRDCNPVRSPHVDRGKEDSARVSRVTERWEGEEGSWQGTTLGTEMIPREGTEPKGQSFTHEKSER